MDGMDDHSIQNGPQTIHFPLSDWKPPQINVAELMELGFTRNQARAMYSWLSDSAHQRDERDIAKFKALMQRAKQDDER